MTHLEVLMPRARKNHQCNYCDGVIEKGEVYRRDAFVGDGSVFYWASHLDCEKLSERMQAQDDYDTSEGVSQGQFEAFVDEECKKRGVTSLSFLQKIDFLKKEMELGEII